MPIKPVSAVRSVSSDGKRVMNIEEFKRWLKKFDADGDGRISKEELRQAVKATGGRFSHWKGRKGVKEADVNGDGFIDDSEINYLVEFAQKHLAVRILPH